MAETAGFTHLRRSPLLVLLLLVVASYSNSFQGGLVFDSAGLVEMDPRIRDATAQNFHAILTGPYWYIQPRSGLYRPLTTLSYLFNYAIVGSGSDPAGYHWVNLGLHCANVVLVYELGGLIFGAMLPSLALAALWGVHPLLTEAVTNVAGRADLIAAFGVLAGLICYIRGASAPEGRWAWLLALAAAQGIGLFSKENAVVLPALILAYQFISPSRVLPRWTAAAFAALAVPLALFFYLHHGSAPHIVIPFSENPLVNAGFWTARITAAEVIAKFLWLFVWPGRLSPDYSYNAIPAFSWVANWEGAKAVIAVAVFLGALAFVLLRLTRRRSGDRTLVFFLAFFFVAAAPTSNLLVLIGSIMAERFAYLPSVGLAGCVVAAISLLLKRRPSITPTIAWATAAVVCLGFAAGTYARNVDWHDERSLWTSAVTVCPEAARPHYNLGTALAQRPDQLMEAIVQFQAAIRIRPDYPEAHYNLGNAYARIPGRIQDSVAEYEAAVRVQPDLADAHYSLGNALAHMPGRLTDAIREYQAALKFRRDSPVTHNNLGNVLAEAGRLNEAVAEYQAAIRLQPDYADAHNNLGNVLVQIPGRLNDAIAEYQTALRIDPNHFKAHTNLGEAFARTSGGLPEAIREYQSALRIRPDYAEAHFALGNAFAQTPGRMSDAVAEYQAALRSQPDFEEARANLAAATALLQRSNRNHQ